MALSVPWSLACCVQMRGVVSRDLCFRFRKAAARKTADPTTGAPAALKYTACPAGCGTFLMDDDPSYAPPGQPKLGEFFDTADGVAVRLGRCPCGALVCARCKALVPAKDERAHVCKSGPGADDAAARQLMAKIGKKCPACSMFIEKNEGCSSMMCGTPRRGQISGRLGGACLATSSDPSELPRSWSPAAPKTPFFGLRVTPPTGTRAHGRVEDALRNGGCAHEFDWNSMRPLKNGRPGQPFNDRQVNFRTGGGSGRRVSGSV